MKKKHNVLGKKWDNGRRRRRMYLYRLIYIKPENQYGQFFFIYHFQPGFTVCLFVSPPPLMDIQKNMVHYSMDLFAFIVSESLFPKLLH